MTVKQIIVGSLIGSIVMGIALHKLHQETGLLSVARSPEISRGTSETASIPTRAAPTSRSHQTTRSLG